MLAKQWRNRSFASTNRCVFSVLCAARELVRTLHLVPVQSEATLMTMHPAAPDHPATGDPPARGRQPSMAGKGAARVRLDYLVHVDLDAWELPEVPVPESVPHHRRTAKILVRAGRGLIARDAELESHVGLQADLVGVVSS